MLLKEWNKDIPFVINFHITKACNMKCFFCFGGFSESGTMRSKDEWISLIKKISKETSFLNDRRINFAGGEPLLVPWLEDLIKVAKQEGFKTSIITNGSLLTEDFINSIKDYIDMIGISIDSIDEDINDISGRKTINGVLSAKEYIDKCNLITKNNIVLKVNTVINKHNFNQNMAYLLDNTKIKRWKVLRMLSIENENYKYNSLCPTDDEFKSFVFKHSKYNPVVEDNSDMTSTYIFVSPNMDLMDNSTSKILVAESLLNNSFSSAFEKLDFNYKDFKKRYK